MNISLLDGSDGFFVVNTEAGDDTVDADGSTALPAASTLPLVVFGGFGSDTIWSGLGADLLFGDLGRVHYTVGPALVARLGGGGPGDLTDGAERDPNRIFNAVAGLVGNDGMQRNGYEVVGYMKAKEFAEHVRMATGNNANLTAKN